MKKFLFTLLTAYVVASLNFANAQADTTANKGSAVGLDSANVQADTTANKIDAGDFPLAFVKKIYLNPSIVSIKKEFERNGGRTVIILPDPKSENIDTISKIEKAMRKLLLFIIEGGKDEAIKLHFNPKNQKQPFSFKHPESIWCKFTRADKDSISRRLNAPFAGTDLYSLNAATFERAVGDGLDYIKQRLRAVSGSCGDKPDHEITKINTKPLSISVHNTAGSRYDTDSKHYAPLALYYEKAFDVHTKTDVYAPAKYLVQGQSDKIAVAIHKSESPFLKQNIRFRKTYDNQTIPILSSSTNDTIRLDLPPNLPTNKPIEIAVEYESPLDSAKYTVGVIMVYVYPIQTPKVNVIAANGASLNESEIKRALDKVYLPVGVNFDVRRLSMSFGSSYPTAIEIEKSGLLSNYPPDLKGYVKDVKGLPTYSKDEYYLVVGLNATAFDGYMPRARNIGFIFHRPDEQMYKTIAHELGHGVFHLKHIFDGDELGGSYKTLTNNLMDYCSESNSSCWNATNLFLHQWKYLNDPASVSWFEGDDEDAASITIGIPEILDAYKNNNGTYSFFTPSGDYITLPPSLYKVAFSTSDPYFRGDSRTRTSRSVPIGSLIRFTVRDSRGEELTFVNRYSGSTGRYYNIGLLDEVEVVASSGAASNKGTGGDSEPFPHGKPMSSWKVYYDLYTDTMPALKIISGFGFYENRQVGFNLYLSEETKARGTGNVLSQFGEPKDNFFAVDFTRNDNYYDNYNNWGTAKDYYKDYFETRISTAVEISSGLETDDFSPTALAFLEEFPAWTKPDNIAAPIVLSIAEWVSIMSVTENFNDCILAQLSPIAHIMMDRLQNKQEIIPGSTIPDPYTQMENEYVSQAQKHTLWDELWDFIGKFKSAQADISKGLDVEIAINKEISGAQNGSQVKAVLEKYSGDCDFELITLENRVKAIELLQGEDELRLITDLTIHANFNGQNAAVVNAYFKNGSALYWKVIEEMTDWIDDGSYDEWIYSLMRMSVEANFNQAWKASIPFGFRRFSGFGKSIHEKEGLSHKESAKKDRIYFQLSVSDYQSCIPKNCQTYEDINYSLKPNDFVQIDMSIASDHKLYEYYEKLGYGKTFIVPAFYLRYMEDNWIFARKMKGIRLLANAVAIITAIPSGSGSFALMSALTITLSASDILVTINEEKIKEQSWGNEFMSIWGVVGSLDLAAGAVTIARGITKKVINGVSYLTFKPKVIADGFRSSSASVRAEANAAYELIIRGYKSIRKIPQSIGQVSYYKGLVQRLFAERLPSVNFKAADNLTQCDVVDNYFVRISSGGVDKNILTIEKHSEGPFLKGQILSQAPDNGTIVGKIDDVKYRKFGSSTIQKGKLHLYKASDDIVVVIGDAAKVGARFIAKSGTELKTFLDDIVTLPAGKTYNGNMYRSLSKYSETNFGTLPDQMTDHTVYSSWGRYDLDGAENAMYCSGLIYLDRNSRTFKFLYHEKKKKSPISQL